MNQENQIPRSKHNIIEELRSLREALNKAPEDIDPNAEIPVLDEVLQTSEEQQIDAIPILADSVVELEGEHEIDAIPILADSVVEQNNETHQLALNSWKLVKKELYHLASTMDNPMSSMTQNLLTEMSSLLEANWEALFNSQAEQQLQQWQQILMNKTTKD